MSVLAAIIFSIVLSITSSVTLDRAQLLSSGQPEATISVSNSSDKPIAYQPLQTVFVQTAHGWQSESSLWPFAFPPVIIAPHSGYIDHVRLPVCKAIESPCSRSVYVEYYIGNRADHATFRSPILSYTIAPDAKQFFDVMQAAPRETRGRLIGVSDDRPVILTYGEVLSTLAQHVTVAHMVVRKRWTDDPDFDFDAFRKNLVSSFRSRGVDAREGMFSFAFPNWSADVLLTPSAGKQKLNDAIRAVANEYGSVVASVTQFNAIDFNRPARASGSERYQQVAMNDAYRRVASFGQIIGRRTTLAYPSISPQARADQFDAYFPRGHAVPDPGLLLPEDLAGDQVNYVMQFMFAGNHAVAAGPLSIASSRLAAGAYSRPEYGIFDGFQPVVEINAEEPELYAVGAASAERSRPIGLTPEFAALSDARRRIAQLAQILDAAPKFESLYALYPGATDTTLIGLASTSSGVPADIFAQLKPQRGTSATVAAYDPSRLGAIPITAAEPSSLIRLHATSQMTLATRAVRLDVYVEAPVTAKALSPPDELEKRLRALPAVRSEFTAAYNFPNKIGYELVLLNATDALLRKTVTTIERAYTGNDASVTAVVRPVIRDCDSVERTLLRESIYANVSGAQRIAFATRRAIRHLLLAAALPMASPRGQCDLAAADPPGIYNAPRTPVAMPASVALTVDTYMIFRTDPR